MVYITVVSHIHAFMHGRITVRLHLARALITFLFRVATQVCYWRRAEAQLTVAEAGARHNNRCQRDETCFAISIVDAVVSSSFVLLCTAERLKAARATLRVQRQHLD